MNPSPPPHVDVDGVWEAEGMLLVSVLMLARTLLVPLIGDMWSLILGTSALIEGGGGSRCGFGRRT